MAKEPGSPPSEGGLELDKINLSDIASRGARKPMRVGDPGVGTGDPGAWAPDKNAPQNKKKSNLALIWVLAVLALLMLVTTFVRRQEFSFNFLTGTGGPSENYLRVGPISATLANEDIIRFSLDIDCKDDKLKERLSGKDSKIRDQIVSVITAPETEELLKEKRYDEIKARIKERLDGISSEPIGDIYFADLIIY